MEDILGLTPHELAKAQIMGELEAAGDFAVRYGLTLSSEQISSIAEKRAEALEATGRVEFGRGIAGALLREFCDSPYITQQNLEETLSDLLDTFYYFKNESDDLISDGELLSLMKHHFDTTCQGSVDYLNGMTVEELCRTVPEGGGPEDEDGKYPM